MRISLTQLKGIILVIIIMLFFYYAPAFLSWWACGFSAPC